MGLEVFEKCLKLFNLEKKSLLKDHTPETES